MSAGKDEIAEAFLASRRRLNTLGKRVLGSLDSHFYWALVFLAALVVFGSVGYLFLENWTYFEALFFTVTTVTTVGYGDVVPTNPTSQSYTIILMLMSMSVILLAVGTFAKDRLRKMFKGVDVMEEMQRRINSLDGHVILAATGRLAQILIEEFMRHEQEFVAILPPSEGSSVEGEFLYLTGNATNDETLLRANVEKARGIVVSLDTDAENVFVSLSAKKLNPAIRIVAEASDTHTISKLKYAGVDEVIIPEQITGMHIRSLVAGKRGEDKVTAQVTETVRRVLSHPDAGWRPKLGGGIDAAVFRALRLMIQELGPEMEETIRALGQEIGRSGFAPTIKATEFRGVVEELCQRWEEAKLGTLADIEITDNSGTVREKECITCYGLPNLGRPVCHLEAGIIEGVLEAKLRRFVRVVERKCWALGDTCCEYAITLSEELPAEAHVL